MSRGTTNEPERYVKAQKGERGGWLRAERHEQVIRKWNTYRSAYRIGDGDRWMVDWLYRDRPLGDWPLSGVSITTSSSPAKGKEGCAFPRESAHDFLRSLRFALFIWRPSGPRSIYIHQFLSPLHTVWNGETSIYIVREKNLTSREFDWKEPEPVKASSCLFRPQICERQLLATSCINNDATILKWYWISRPRHISWLHSSVLSRIINVLLFLPKIENLIFSIYFLRIIFTVV